MLRFQVELAENEVWKVCQILSDDDAGSGPNCCGDNVPVVRVWQHDGIEQVFVFGYESLRQRLIHKAPGPRQFLGG